MNEQTSLIILLHNTIENECHDKSLDCWDAVLKYTLSPYKIILIDNGSTDPKTKKWVGELKKNSEKICLKYPSLNELKILTNKTEKTGAPTGFNLGISYSMEYHPDCDYLAFLNNDMILNESCENWIGRIINVMDDFTGMGGALISSGKSFDVGRDSECVDVYFGCSVLKKEVIDTIGYIDERYLVGMFEDNDFNLRMRRFGWKVVILKDLNPVHDHTKSAIYQYDGPNKVVFKGNRERFNKKWKKWGYQK